MKKLLVSLLLLTVCYAVAQDTQPRALVQVFKEKAEQDTVIKQVRIAERNQKIVFEKFKAIYAASKASLKNQTEFQKIMLGITVLSAIGGIAALAHYLVFGDHSNLTLL
ncbi:MAG: hypothetical protein M1114_02135 [Candidatus Dependentiae bacterium]|nr:hypothetical protein [Candidatus Dependentiae bacterium]